MADDPDTAPINPTAPALDREINEFIGDIRIALLEQFPTFGTRSGDRRFDQVRPRLWFILRKIYEQGYRRGAEKGGAL
jgi:hypothetical protein